jgi:predicted metal-dependent hydrolase
MKHLPTFCEWIIRRFALQHHKDIRVTFCKLDKREIGKCTVYSTKHGYIYYHIELHLKKLYKLKPKLIEDLLLHECLHTLVPNHGPVFKQLCKAYKVDKRFHSGRNKTKKSIYNQR